jgi:hypothetical protein
VLFDDTGKARGAPRKVRQPFRLRHLVVVPTLDDVPRAGSVCRASFRIASTQHPGLARAVNVATRTEIPNQTAALSILITEAVVSVRDKPFI